MGGARARLVLAAVLLNALFGALFGWSLLLEPLRRDLDLSLGTLSAVPSLAIIAFTLGMLFHARLLRRLAPAPLIALLLLLGGLGHGLYALWPGYLALLLGYGGLFGLTGGAAYGLAVALVGAAAPPGQAGLIGLPIASYALTGMLLSLLAFFGLSLEQAAQALGGYGLLLAVAGLPLALLLRGQPRLLVAAREEASQAPAAPLWPLILANGALCCPGLVVMAHSVTLMMDRGALALAPAAPLIVNAGYLAGALLGGAALRWTSARGACLAAFTLAVLASLLLLLPVTASALAALAAVGASLGCSAAVFLLLLVSRYGVAGAPSRFGKVVFAYGVAGLLMPFLAGQLHDLTGGYDLAILGAAAIALAGGLLLRRATRAPASPLPLAPPLR